MPAVAWKQFSVTVAILADNELEVVVMLMLYFFPSVFKALNVEAY